MRPSAPVPIGPSASQAETPYVPLGQLVQRKPQEQQHEDAHGERHRARPKDIAEDEGEESLGGREMRRQQSAACGGDLRGDDGEQPHRRQLLHRVLLAGEHEIRDGEAANDRHCGVGLPKSARDADGKPAPEEIRAEGEKAVDDGREPHRDGPKKHRHHRVPENQRRFAREEDPARAVEKAEQREERNVREPQTDRDRAQPGDRSGNWFKVSASAPVPMVTVNQFGVKLRTISRSGFASLRANG